MALSSDNGSHSLPLLALRDVVVYPHMQIALFVGREPSVKAIQEAQENFDELVLVVAQKDSLSEDIQLDNLYEYGTVCRIVSTMPHDSDENCIKVLIEGQYRAKLDKVT
ncbi:LON peptidase substrate-binding domain-containing protein, partial [Leptospira borgpetersenii serovar Balcanica]|nr:LON peptidase substrate-binding domain-containing protein [Leptospira borgpetersenii serovar Balcanica]